LGLMVTSMYTGNDSKGEESKSDEK
jgi:hypothetical protein